MLCQEKHCFFHQGFLGFNQHAAQLQLTRGTVLLSVLSLLHSSHCRFVIFHTEGATNHLPPARSASRGRLHLQTPLRSSSFQRAEGSLVWAKSWGSFLSGWKSLPWQPPPPSFPLEALTSTRTDISIRCDVSANLCSSDIRQPPQNPESILRKDLFFFPTLQHLKVHSNTIIL